MAALRPYEKIPIVNAGAVLLVGSEESHIERLALAILKEPKAFDVKIHTTQSLPLPFEGEHLRPRFDLAVFLINLHSQLSLSNVLSSMMHLDAYFYLGKICFLATQGKPGSVQHCVVDISTVKNLADKHLSILIQSEFDNEDDVTYTAQRLLNILKICAGLVPGGLELARQHINRISAKLSWSSTGLEYTSPTVAISSLRLYILVLPECSSLIQMPASKIKPATSQLA